MLTLCERITNKNKEKKTCDDEGAWVTRCEMKKSVPELSTRCKISESILI